MQTLKMGRSEKIKGVTKWRNSDKILRKKEEVIENVNEKIMKLIFKMKKAYECIIQNRSEYYYYYLGSISQQAALQALNHYGRQRRVKDRT